MAIASVLSCPSLCAYADDAMPKSSAEAITMEVKDALPLTKFYDPPQPLAAAEPGTLIRSERFAGYSLPEGASAVRILYHSRALNGEDVAVSGVVLLPAGRPPQGGWPLIAWAHGTNGVARICAPSLMKDVAYGDEGLMPMVAAGFAVVATDYAGLGTPGAHQYLNKIPQASDVIYSIPAARQAVHGLGKKWVAIGHSQGGIAVWGVAEREVALRDPTYAGGISVAGYMDFESWASDGVAPDPDNALFWPLEAFGIKASYPSFDLSRMLTPMAQSRYHDVTTQGCYYYAYAVFKELGQQRSAYADWANSPEAQQYLHDSQSGDKAIFGPLLVVAGDDDRVVSIKSIMTSVQHACSIGLPIEFRHFPKLDHDPLMQETTPEQIAWVRDRLAGKPWSSNCPAP
jgi:pimeloyl-ACP methyl ester carboxylesterase